MSKPHVTVVAEITAKPGCEEELKNALLSVIEPVRKEEGCIQYDLHVSNSEPGKFLFYENWESPEALAKHAQAEHMKAFGAKAAALVGGPSKIVTYTRIA
ncbi:MAG TPA: putative quinol monooxygenase [Bryobacteraceae bacterium]|nr:putative quinol monooxygenase [Bryobacteraceae bacterium]